jgi:hypothetical protein
MLAKISFPIQDSLMITKTEMPELKDVLRNLSVSDAAR